MAENWLIAGILIIIVGSALGYMYLSQPASSTSTSSSNSSIIPTSNGYITLYNPTVTVGLLDYTVTINGVVVPPTGKTVTSINWNWDYGGTGNGNEGMSYLSVGWFPQSYKYYFVNGKATYTVQVTANLNDGTIITAQTNVVLG